MRSERAIEERGKNDGIVNEGKEIEIQRNEGTEAGIHKSGGQMWQMKGCKPIKDKMLGANEWQLKG